MKKLLARLGLSERNWLILLVVLLYAFGAYVSASASMGIFYAVAMPWLVTLLYRERQNGIEKTGTLRVACAALAVSVLSAFVTLSVAGDWGCIFGFACICWLLLLFPGRNHSLEDAGQEIFSLGACMVSLYMPLAVLAILSMLLRTTVSLPGIDGLIGIQEDWDVGGRFYIMAHPNITARYAVFNMLFSIYVLTARKGKLLRGWFALNLLLNFIVLAHTQSRTCYIAMAAALGMIALRGIYLRLGEGVKGLLAGAVAAVLVFALTLTLLNGVYKVDVGLAQSLSDSEKVQQTEFVSHVEKQGQFDVTSNGRDTIWSLALNYLKEHPRYLLTGMGEGSLIDAIAEEYPQMSRYAHLHNSFLAALARYGVFYLICVIALLCMLVKPCWRLLMRREDGAGRGMFIAPVFIVVMLLMSLTEEMLFARQRYANLLFFFFSGIILKYGKIQKEYPHEN